MYTRSPRNAIESRCEFGQHPFRWKTYILRNGVKEMLPLFTTPRPTGCAHKAMSDSEFVGTRRSEKPTLSRRHAYKTLCRYPPHLFSDLGAFRCKRSEHDAALSWQPARESCAFLMRANEINANAHTILTVRERHVTQYTMFSVVTCNERGYCWRDVATWGYGCTVIDWGPRGVNETLS